jgi:hypothetical protein
MNIPGEYGKAIARARRGGPWELVGVSDYFEETQSREYTECDFCGFPRVRYVHLITRRGKEQGVGCVCACYLCASEEPKIAEAEFKSRAQRKVTALRARKAFDDSFPFQWIRTYKGNWRKTVRGMNVVLFRVPYGKDKGKFCVAIDGQFGEKFSTGDEALEATAKILYPMPGEEQASSKILYV